MDYTEYFLLFLGVFLVLLFLRYVMTAQNILGMVLKNPEAKIVDRKDCPTYLREFYEIKEKELLELGFIYQFNILIDSMFTREQAAKIYMFVYYHRETKTYATLSAADTLDNLLPFRVVFRTYFKNGKRLMTYNGLKHALIGNMPDTIARDAYLETVEKQYAYHLKNTAELDESEIKEFDGKPNPDEFIREETAFIEKYLKQLVADGFIYPVKNERYLIRTMASLRITQQLLSGLKKLSQLHVKIKKTGKQVELPVELEVENYLMQKSAANQKIRNRSGKLFFLLLSIALFAVTLLFFVPPVFVAVLVGAIFLHESGHLLAMRILGFKNLRMLFIPLFGAVAMGSDKGVPPYKKVIAFFAGPVPGIILAFLLIFLHFQLDIYILDARTMVTIIVVLLFINYLNLIPVLPFDGGQVFNTIIFSRFPVLQFIFNLVSFIALVSLTLFLKFPLLLVIAALNLFGFHQYFVRRRFVSGFEAEMQEFGNLPEKERIRKIFRRFKDLPFKEYNFRKKFLTAGYIESGFSTRKASKKTVIFTLLFYVFLFAAPVLVLFSARDLPFFSGRATYADPCKAVRETAKPVDLTR